VKPFTVLYVYERRDVNGRLWFRCGAGTRGSNLFWLRDDRVSEWKQSMVLLFDEKVGRQPLLFFKRKNDILDIAGSPGIRDALESLARRFAEYMDSQQVPPADYPVAAMEPTDEEGAVPREQFYIMPIFNFDDQLEAVKLLDVASINPGNVSDEVVSQLPDNSAPAQPSPGAEGSQKLAVCFVIDTTMSMGPYIEETRSVIRNYYDAIMRSGNAENTYLAFVAFRSSPAAAPLTEYGTRLISDFKNANERAAIESAIAQVKEAEHSTHAFNEDSIAGINEALKLDWDRFGGGIIILVSDAGPLPRSDGNSASRDDPGAVRAKAEAKKVRLVTLHLRTPEGAANHRYARDAYEALAADLAGRKAYIPVEVPSRESGPSAFARLQTELVNALDSAGRGMNPVSQAEAAKPPRPDETPEEAARNVGSLLGYSVRLDYLGAKNKATPPSVVRSWIPDKDLGFLDSQNPRDVRTVKVAVLLTKSQLSSLNQAVRAIVAGASDMISGSSRNFFDAVVSAAAQAGRDPNELTADPKLLSEMGLLGEYLEGLPYQSRVMSLNQEVWDSWTPGQQRDFILELESKLSRYAFIDSDMNNWLKTGADTDGDWLYRVPLDSLP
jgi:serine/threonine-protein kinase PpkA